MGRFYTIKNAATDLTAAGTNYDWLELLAGDDSPVILWGFKLSQKTLLGDAAELNVLFRILRMTATVTSGSGGVTPSVTSPNELDHAGVAAGFTAEGFNSTVATTSGSTREYDEFYWNFRQTPYEFWYPRREWCPVAKQTEGLFLRMDDTLPSTVKCAATFYVEEGA